jgi:hypothetical protein
MAKPKRKVVLVGDRSDAEDGRTGVHNYISSGTCECGELGCEDICFLIHGSPITQVGDLVILEETDVPHTWKHLEPGEVTLWRVVREEQ